MEQDSKINVAETKKSFKEFLHVLTKNIWLLIVIVVLGTAIGTVYAKTREPNYVAKSQVLYVMGDGENISADVNNTYYLKPTFMDFCSKGIVVDRANFYYKEYMKGVNGYTLDEFVNEVNYLEFQIENLQDKIEVLNNLLECLKEKEEANMFFKDSYIIMEQAYLQQLYLLEKVNQLEKQAYLTQRSYELEQEIQQCYEDIIKIERELSPLPTILNVITDMIKEIKITVTERNNPGLNYTPGKDEPLNIYDLEDTVNSNGEVTRVAYISLIREQAQALKSSELYYEYKEEERVSGYIEEENITIINYDSQEEENIFTFGVNYLDSVALRAMEKNTILLLAITKEANYSFASFNPQVESMGIQGCTLDIAQERIILVGAIAGFVFALVIIFIKQLLDNTVKTRQVAEAITRSPVFAILDKQEVAHND